MNRLYKLGIAALFSMTLSCDKEPEVVIGRVTQEYVRNISENDLNYILIMRIPSNPLRIIVDIEEGKKPLKELEDAIKIGNFVVINKSDLIYTRVNEFNSLYEINSDQIRLR